MRLGRSRDHDERGDQAAVISGWHGRDNADVPCVVVRNGGPQPIYRLDIVFLYGNRMIASADPGANPSTRRSLRSLPDLRREAMALTKEWRTSGICG
jgi:hypothetical protein